MTYTLAAVSGKRRLWKARGPGVPGPYNSTKIKTSRPNRRDGSFLCE